MKALLWKNLCVAVLFLLSIPVVAENKSTKEPEQQSVQQAEFLSVFESGSSTSISAADSELFTRYFSLVDVSAEAVDEVLFSSLLSEVVDRLFGSDKLQPRLVSSKVLAVVDANTELKEFLVFNEEGFEYYWFAVMVREGAFFLVDYEEVFFEVQLSHLSVELQNYAAADLALLREMKTFLGEDSSLAEKDLSMVWQHYDRLSDDFTSNPFAIKMFSNELVTAVLSLNGLSKDVLVDVFSELERRFDNEDALIYFYLHALSNNHKELKSVLQKLRERVGDDVAIRNMELTLALGLTGKAAYGKAYQFLLDDPDYDRYYSTLFDHFVREREFDDALLVVDAIYTRFDIYYVPEMLVELGGHYAAFAEFEGYKTWMSNHYL